MKKVLSILCLSLLMMSMSSNNIIVNEVEKDCFDQVIVFVAQAEASGQFTDEELQWFGNGALAVFCHGYTWNQVIGAP